MKKAASIFLRTDITHRDVESLAGWMENPHVTRYLNEDASAPEQLEACCAPLPRRC